jgi:hypothetical protein
MNRARLRERGPVIMVVTLISALTVGSISAQPPNKTLVVTGISSPTYVNDTVVVNVIVRNTGVMLANSTYLIFENKPKEISVNNGGAFDIAPNSNGVFTVKIAAAIGASGNYDLKFHASGGNAASESRTIYIQVGTAPVSGGDSVSPARITNPLPGFEVGFGIAALAIATYALSRRR